MLPNEAEITPKENSLEKAINGTSQIDKLRLETKPPLPPISKNLPQENTLPKSRIRFCRENQVNSKNRILKRLKKF